IEPGLQKRVVQHHVHLLRPRVAPELGPRTADKTDGESLVAPDARLRELEEVDRRGDGEERQRGGAIGGDPRPRPRRGTRPDPASGQRTTRIASPDELRGRADAPRK